MERTDQELVRIEKANRIREMGMDPFGHRFDRTHSSEDIREQYSKYEHDELENLEDKVTIAGRIMFIRKMGKASFFSIQDKTGKMQVYISVNDSLYNIDDLDTVSDPDYYTATTVAKSFTNMVQALPSEKNLTIYDEEKIKSARTVYDSLTDYQKSFISPDTVKTLEQLEAKLKTLKGNTEESSKGE